MKKVLIVEDDPTFSFMLEEELKPDYEIHRCVDAMSALSEVAVNLPDLILLDVDILGNMDGFTVLNAVRKEDRTKNIPVIVLTNLGDTYKEKFLRAGANEYHAKSEVNLTQVHESVNKYLQATPII
jgi:two-component system response regulator RpaA